jgi:hypothetical protein
VTPCILVETPNADRTPDANSHFPCRAHAMLCRGLKKSLSDQHGARHARSMGVAWYV